MEREGFIWTCHEEETQLLPGEMQDPQDCC